MGFSHRDFLAIIYSFSIFLLVAITVYAFVIGYLFRRKNSTAEGFITARGQVSMWRIAWSFYAGAVGAWVITGPATYTPWAGVIGNVMYALSSGLPVLMIAYAGPVIQRQVPHVLSLTDFIGWRYGWVAKSYVVLLCLFNMSIALLAEYTTIGSLFGAYVGSVPAPIIVVVGVLTSAYTIYGGLLVSIYTDTVQGVGSIVFFLIIGIYMAATFRPDLRTPIPCDAYDPDTNPLGFCIRGTNLTGWSSIFAMPASLFTATIFSEAMWQRAWASSSPRNLRRGAWIAAAGITVVVFFAGFCGLLAAWAGLISPDTNMNLYMLQVLTGAVNEYGQVGNWVGVFVVLLAVCMNSSAVDSLQNGLAAAISSHFLKGVPHSLAWTRVAVLLVNVPLVVLGTRNYTVLELFLLGNMLCSTSATPVLMGLIDRLHPYVGGVGMIASCLLSFTLTSVFGVHYFYGLQEGDLGFDRDTSRTVAGGMNFTWLGNGYNWEFFAVAIGVSTGAMLLFIAINWAISKTRLRKPAVIGFVAPATHPEAFPKEVADDLSNDDKPGVEKQGSSSPDSQSVEEEKVAA